MRFLVFTLLGLSLAAHRGWETALPAAPNAPAETSQPAPALPLPEVTTETARPAVRFFFLSNDDGRTWEDFSPALPSDLEVNSMLIQDGAVYLGARNGALYHSIYPGLGYWQREEPGQTMPDPSGSSPGRDLIRMYPGASGPYAGFYQGGFFRKIPGTDLWQPMHAGMEKETPLSVLETSKGTLVVGYNDGIYKTADDGNTWKQVFNKGAVWSLVAANGVLMGTGPQGVLRSTDGGEHWETALSNPTADYHTSLLGDRIAVVHSIDPIYSKAGDAPVRVSADGGKTWQHLDGGLSNYRVYQLRQAGSYLYCSHSGGISRSANGGKSWELVRPLDLTDEMVYFHLAVSGQTVFAVKVKGGC